MGIPFYKNSPNTEKIGRKIKIIILIYTLMAIGIAIYLIWVIYFLGGAK